MLLGVMFLERDSPRNAADANAIRPFVAYLMSTVWNALFQVDSRHAIPVKLAFKLIVYVRDPGCSCAQGAGLRGGAVSDLIIFQDVSKFYGEIWA